MYNCRIPHQGQEWKEGEKNQQNRQNHEDYIVWFPYKGAKLIAHRHNKTTILFYREGRVKRPSSISKSDI
jgi:hypothetical protein